MPITTEVLDLAIDSINAYMLGEAFDKRPLKTLRGVLDGMCPQAGRQVGFRMTPAFHTNKKYFERPMQRALIGTGRTPPRSDEGVYQCVRNAIAVVGQLAKSNGKEIETERQRLRNNLRWVRDFLRNLRQPTATTQSATSSLARAAD